MLKKYDRNLSLHLLVAVGIQVINDNFPFWVSTIDKNIVGAPKMQNNYQKFCLRNLFNYFKS